MTSFCLACVAMRSRFELRLESETRPEADLIAAGEEALAEIERVEVLLSVYQPGSDLYQVNANAGVAPVRVSPLTVQFLHLAAMLARETSGAFDPTVGPLLTLWGVTGEQWRVPTHDEVSATQVLVGMEKVEIEADACTVFLPHAGMRLDPGAIGKGWAIDRAVSLLDEAGMTRFLLHGGTSTVYARGTWQIEVSEQGVVTLTDSALSVAAGSGKSYTTPEGRVIGHIIDPRTGYPVENLRAVTVQNASAATSDALATAALCGFFSSPPR
jgi:thiamine biosynthesis lipoprotein